MKTQKMNFKNIKNVLSRTEMKKIMAGSSGGGGNGCAGGGQSGPCCEGFQFCPNMGVCESIALSCPW